MTKTWDAVLVGGGHNGLVAAAYLARAGRRVLVLERRAAVGGAVAASDGPPGFRYPACSYLCSLLDPEIAVDLDLTLHGLRILPVDPALFAPHPDGAHLTLWRDPVRAAAEIRRFSEADARRYLDFWNLVDRLRGPLRPLLRVTPPALASLTAGDAWAALKAGIGIRRLGPSDLHELLRIGPMCVADLVGEWFETERLRAAVAAPGIWGTAAGPWSAGTAAALLYQLIGQTAGSIRLPGIAQGGMGKLAESLASAARTAGAEIRTGAAVARIDVKSDRACGVILASGEEIPARAVVSNADPRTTVLSLLAPGTLDPTVVRAVRNIRARGTVAKVNLAVAELPRFLRLDDGGGGGSSPGPHHRAAIHVGPDVDYLERAFDDSKYGRISAAPYLDVLIPSVVDPTLAPPGQHVVSIFAQHAPYALADGSWDDRRREELADRVVDTLARLIPNLKGSILHRQVLTPLDLEREFGLAGGSIFHEELALDQLFFMRPIPGWARYRTPIRGLYLCGAGTHPGGGVSGIPGANAAREVELDMRSGAC
jgi:phytoene dehydrogenase-like protein